MPTTRRTPPQAGSKASAEFEAASALSLVMKAIGDSLDAKPRLFPFGVNKIQLDLKLPGGIEATLLVEGPDRASADSPKPLRRARAGRIPGLDVSKYQEKIDWNRVDSEYKFVLIRASDGSVASNEQNFGVNWTGARGAGLVCGAYHYFRPNASMAEIDKQSALFLQMFDDNVPLPEIGYLPPVLDIEREPGAVSVDDYVAGISRWIDAVETSLRFAGQKVIIYTSASFWKELGNPGDFSDRLLWVADYSQDPPRLPRGWTDYAFLQYSDAGQVPGVPTDTDLNYFNGDMAALKALTKQ